MRILFAQPSLQPPGGGNAVAAWMVQALKDAHDVTLLTWSPLDLTGVNRFYGTTLRPGDVRPLRVPGWQRALPDALPLSLQLLRTALLLRETRRRSAEHDLVVSANNESDFGRPGVQYVEYPWNTFAPPPARLRWYQAPLLVRAYVGLCRYLSGFSIDGMRRNVTLVNSDWSRRVFLERYGVAARTVYPPVPVPGPGRPWEAREPGFVCIGRIAPVKELDRVLDIVAAVRREMPAVRLHLVGTAEDRRYHARIAQRARGEGAALHENLSREALLALLAGQRYGIHGMREEHFGMAPAEMVAAGCIVWVPDSGGQVEIVGEARLTYTSVDDAVAKILRVLREPDEQAALRAHLAAMAPRFSTERFIGEVREVVAQAPPAA